MLLLRPALSQLHPGTWLFFLPFLLWLPDFGFVDMYRESTYYIHARCEQVKIEKEGPVLPVFMLWRGGLV